MQTGGFSDFAKTCLAEQLDCTDCQAVNSDCIDCDSDSDDWWKIRQVTWYAYVCSIPVWVGASTDRKRFNTSCKRLRRTTSSCNVLQVFHSDRHQTVLQRIQPGHTFLRDVFMVTALLLLMSLLFNTSFCDSSLDSEVQISIDYIIDDDIWLRAGIFLISILWVGELCTFKTTAHFHHG